MTELIKPLPYDVMAFGASELSDGIDALAEYVKIVGQKFVCTNLEFSKSSESGRYLSEMCHKTMIKMYGELQIGIISYINNESLPTSVPGVTILDEVEALNAGISELEATSADITIILALGYSRHALDRHVLDNVRKINILISGNSYAMFYNGTPPSGTVRDYDYPHIIHREANDRSSKSYSDQMVVGSYFHLMYAGKLKLMTTNLKMGLDEEFVSNPVYMDGEEDEDEEDLVDKHQPTLARILGESIGFNSYVLDGSRLCRYRECSMGSLLADSMVEAAVLSAESPPPGAWTIAGVALLDSGRVSASLERGVLYGVDIYDAVRRDSSLELLRVTGAELRALLENSTRHQLERSAGFLQVSGLQVLVRPPERNHPLRLNISVVCTECQMPHYELLNDTAEYAVVVTTTLAERLTAPDGQLAADRANRSRRLHDSLRGAATDYISKISPVLVGSGDRIVMHVHTEAAAATVGPPPGWPLAAAAAAALLLAAAPL